MGCRRLWQVVAMGLCLASVAFLPTLLGEDQDSPNLANGNTTTKDRQASTAPESASTEVLRELIRLREQVGANVLSGTLLEVPPDESTAEFASSVRKALGLSTDSIAKQDRTLTAQEIVITIRTHCVHLDRIANEMEDLRHYDNADQLRETAKQLRLIARQFYK